MNRNPQTPFYDPDPKLNRIADRVRAAGLRVTTEDGRTLHVSGHPGSLTAELHAMLTFHKDEIASRAWADGEFPPPGPPPISERQPPATDHIRGWPPDAVEATFDYDRVVQLRENAGRWRLHLRASRGWVQVKGGCPARS